MHDGLHDVDDEEAGDERVEYSDEVPAQANVDLTVPFEGAKGFVPSEFGGSRAEWHILLPQTRNILVHADLELRSDLVLLDHLDYAGLLVVDFRKGWSNLSQALIDIALHIGIINYKSRDS